MRNALSVTTPSDREVRMTRTFNAPRRLVWEAMTKPELLRRWLFAPPGWTMTTCEEDPRVGGTFFWAWDGPDGPAMSMRGVYKEIVPLERVVRTESFTMGADTPIGEQLATLELEDRGEQTRLTIILHYATKEARDGALASGMEGGMNVSYDQLDSLLPELAAHAR